MRYFMDEINNLSKVERYCDDSFLYNGIAFIAKNIRVCKYKFDAASLPYSNFFVDFYAFKSRKRPFSFYH